MRFFVFGIIGSLLLIGGWYVATTVEATRTCYITKEKDIDELAFRLQSYGGDKTPICTGSYEMVNSLGECLVKADTNIPQKIHAYLAPAVAVGLHLVRNGGKELKAFQDAHDLICSDYPDLMFTPPEYLVR